MNEFLEVELGDFAVFQRTRSGVLLRLELLRAHGGETELVAALDWRRGLFGGLLFSCGGGFGAFAAELEEVELVGDFHGLEFI